MHDYERYDGLGLAELVKRREVSPTELLEAALARIDARNPRLNAVVTQLRNQARADIAQGLPAGAFEGVPFLIKELVVSVAGTATTSSSRLYAQNVASADSEVVARFRRAGLVIVGKTNSSEFGVSPTARSALYGTTRNPWDDRLSPGGSSGGSAAAVAAGMVPLAHANDAGGSIRIPASCCGLFGLKPTRARVTAGPELGEGLNGLANQHAVTRSVRDSAALLDAIAGPLPGDPYLAPAPQGSFLHEVDRPPGRLRIGFTRRGPAGQLAPECMAALDDAARLCAQLGHDVDEAEPQFDRSVLREAFITVYCVNLMANVARATGGALPRSGLIEPLTRALADRGRLATGVDFVQALQQLHLQARQIARFFQSHDVWLTPTMARLPPPVEHFPIEAGDVQAWAANFRELMPYTFVANATGQPSASLPLYWSAGGIPVGVQFTARYAGEAQLLQLSAQLEAARPWFDRRPARDVPAH